MTKIHKYFRAGLLLLLCRLQVVLASPPGTAVSHPVQEPSEVTPLELDKPIERELSAAQKHTYQLTLSEKHYVKVVVEQRGIDVVVRLFGPGDKRILDIDGESRLQGHEILEWVVNQTGPYKIEIAPRYKSVPAGRYQIRLGEMRTVTEQDMSLDQARLLHAQARREFQAGKTNEASHIEEQVLRIREQVLEPEHLDVAAALFALGLYQRNDGEIPKAEASYLRALAIREKALPPDHPDISFVLHNLGYLYYSDLRDYVRAQSFYERSLAIKEKAFGVVHPLVASTLLNMGLVQWKAKDYARAKAYFQQAMEIMEKASGPGDDGVALCAHNLGIVYKESGDYAQGEAYYRQALQIWEKIYGKEHPRVALGLESLGILYRDKGDYVNAEPFLQRALDIEVKTEGASHPDVANTLVILGRMYEAKGDSARAVEVQSRAAAIEEKNIALSLSIGSERQKLAYFSSMMREADRRISLHVRSAPDDSRARDLAMLMVLQRKGRVLDALADTAGVLRRSLSAPDQALLDRLNSITEELSRLVVDGPNGSTTEHEKKIKTLEEQRDQIEEDISLRSAGLYQPSQPLILEAIHKLLPENSALLEFAIYHPSDPRVAIEHDIPSEPHYVAYVLRSQGEVQWKELGAVKDIDVLIDRLREALGDPQRKDVQQRARAVDEKVMQPLRASLGDATQLLVSPDGELNLLPFAALADENGRYLIQRYSFSYLTSGRDLLRMRVAHQSKNKPLVVADPFFGEPPAAQLVQAGQQSRVTATNSRRRSVTSARSLSEVYFAPLEGTAEEAHEIQTVFPDATVLSGAQATKRALRAIASPRLLHIATHGFFLAAPSVGGSSAQPVSASAQIDNPLLRSGLALAGANMRSGQTDDGILTALEASGLNLSGTKLVVLSACDTGLGEVHNGEGVYGLRRSFVLAGAESLVMSLWPISDYTTRELMTRYYQNLKQGLGRGAALRQVQLDLLKRNPHLHPFYWANFIQSGDWSPLNPER